MKIYQQAQQQYKTDIKKKVKRQVQVVKPDATDEEVDAVLKSEGGRDALYKQSILAGGVNDQIKYVIYILEMVIGVDGSIGMYELVSHASKSLLHFLLFQNNLC